MKTKVPTYTYSISAMLGLLLFGATSASAAVVSFSAADYTDGGISTSGTLVGALNAGTAETVNTVDFAALTAADANAGPVALAGGVSVGIFGGASVNDGANGTAGALTLDGVWSSGSNGNIHFAGLTDTQEYEIQFVFSDDRAVLSPDLVGVWDNADGSGAADLTTVDITGDAQIVTGTFTADAATQDFWLDQATAVGTFPGYVGALQIRAIPEPATLGMVAMFGGAMLFIRRKMMI